MNLIALLLALIQAVSTPTDRMEEVSRVPGMTQQRPSYIYPETDIEQRDVVAAIVIDGDTFRGDDGQSYRLIGINAPEIAHPEYNKPEGEPGGEEATAALRALIENKSVTAYIDRAHPLDRYGRTVAVIMLDDQDVNLEMLRSGLAEPRYLDLSPMIDSPVFLATATSDDRQVNSLDTSLGFRNSEIRFPPQSGAHLLAPGDRIRVVIGNQTQDFTINPDGEILIKGLGIFRAAGATSPQASSSLDSAIHARGIPAPPTTVFYLAPPPARTQTPRNITVLGAVHRPGTQTAATFVDAVREANPDTTADLRNVILDHAGESHTIDAAGAARGETTVPPLTEGDRILIPRRPEVVAGQPDTPQTVNVLGDVAKPGAYPPGTLTAVLASAGGPTTTARLSAIHVRQPDGHSQTYDLTRITTGYQPDPQLTPNSTVFVESNEPRRQSMSDLSTIIGIFSTLALLGLRFGM